MSVDDIKLSQLTTDIVAAYVEKNHVTIDQLPALIRSVREGLGAVSATDDVMPPAAKVTAAQIRRSITPDALISFEDGRPYKQLKRHLGTLGLTPDAYRAKWGLPADYPTVAANYSATRSALAKAAGLGRKVAVAPAAAGISKAEPPKPRIKGKLGLFGKLSG